MTTDYEQALSEELERLDYPWLGDQFWGDPVKFWATMVESCLNGYSGPVPEYEYELQVRDTLEGIIFSEKLKQYAEHVELVGRVAAADAKFRDILIDDPYNADQPWWRAGIPNLGGQLFCESLSTSMTGKVRMSSRWPTFKW